MSLPVCRIGDCVVGTCDAHESAQDFVGVWTTGSDKVTADGIGVVRVGDTGTTDCGHTFIAVSGSDITDEYGLPIVRIGDIVHVLEGGVGVTVTGSDTVVSD